jgi:bile acid:Na+ symporter, BASS family
MVHKLIEENFAPIIIFGIISGLIFSEFALFEFIVPFLLAFTIFIASLKVDFNLFFNYLKDIRFFGSRFVLIKLIFPLIVFFSMNFISPELALGGLLLIATPSGMSNIVLSDIMKGNNELTLAFTIASHMLSFVYIPLLVLIATQELVSFDYFSLFFSLVLIVLIPLILAFIVKKFLWKKISIASNYFSALMVFLIFLIVLIIISSNRISFFSVFSFLNSALFVLILLFLLMFSGLLMANNRKDKIAFSLSAFHVNGVLGLFIATQFFSQGVVLVMISLQLFVDSLIAFFKWFSSKYIK